MIKNFFYFLVYLVAVIDIAYADSKIVAIVGEDVITQKDVKDRYKFFLIENSQINISNLSQEKAVLRNILKSMIDEIILSQELKRYNIKASQGEINNAVAYIERAQKLGKGKFFDYVISLGLSKEYAISQIKRNILWDKFLSEIIAPQVQLSQHEIFEFVAKESPNKLVIDYVLVEGDSSELSRLIINSKSCSSLKLSNRNKKVLIKKESNIKLNEIKNYQLKKAIMSTAQNHPSYIFYYNNFKAFVFVCEKKIEDNAQDSQNFIERLKQHKVHLQADYHLKNLAKNKYIEVLEFE